MGSKKGIKTYGKRAVVAMLYEYKLLHKFDIFVTQDATIIYRQERYRALRTVNIIKENRCGKIKGRTCADGILQRTYIPREEVTSPIITLEAIVASLLIEAHEGRSV